MAAFNFPNSPSTNDTHTENGVTFKWNGTVWKRQNASYTDATNLNISGISTFGGVSTFTGDATFSGNVAIGKTLTYEDVKNVDSVGVITSRAGINLTGGNITLGDSGGNSDDKLVFGAGSDFKIFHNGSNNYIDVAGDGNLYVRPKTDFYLQNYTTGEVSIAAIADGKTSLYHNGNQKFETISTGIKVLGSESGNAEIEIFGDEGDDNNDKWKLMTNANANFYLQNYGAGSWQNSILARPTGATELYNTGNLKLATTTTGIDVTGIVKAVSDGNAGVVLHRTFSGNVSGATNTPQLDFTLTDTATSNQVVAKISPQALAGTGNAFKGNLRFFTANDAGTSTERLRIDTAGRLQIGASNNTGTNTKLVVGAGNNINTTAIINTGDVDVDALWLSNWDGSTTTNKVIMHFDSSGRGGWNIGMPAATDAFVIEDDGGAERLHINSGGGCHIGLPAITKAWDTHAISVTTNSATFACPGTLSVFGGTGFATANMAGGGIRFVGYYAAGAFTTFAHVAGVKENTTSGHYGGALTFHTRENGNLGAERLRIDSSGFIRQQFTSNNSTTAEGFEINNMNNATGNNASLIFSNDSGTRKKAAIAHIDNGNYGHGDFVFALDGGDSGALHLTNDERVRIRPSGVDYTLKVKGADQVEGYSCNTWSASLYFSSGATHTICTFSTGGNDSQAVATMDYASLYSYASNNRWGGQVMAIARKTSSNSSAEATNNIDAATGGTDSNIKPTFFWDVSTPGAVKLKVTTGSSVQVVGRIQVTYRDTWTLTRNYSAE